MSSPTASRAVRALRHPHQLRLSMTGRRGTSVRKASTTASEVSNATKQRASQATSKASEGLTRVKSAAGPAVAKVASAASGALGRVGGRTGRLIGTVQSMIPHVTYYSKVGLELGKIIFESRQMSPPSMATFQAYWQPLLNTIRQPSTITALKPSALLGRLRSMNREQVTTAGIVAAEGIGFFTVGEMIGRMKIVGYRSSSSHEEH